MEEGSDAPLSKSRDHHLVSGGRNACPLKINPQNGKSLPFIDDSPTETSIFQGFPSYQNPAESSANWVNDVAIHQLSQRFLCRSPISHWGAFYIPIIDWWLVVTYLNFTLHLGSMMIYGLQSQSTNDLQIVSEMKIIPYCMPNLSPVTLW